MPPGDADHYTDLLLATLEQMNQRIETLGAADLAGRRALHEEIAAVRADIAELKAEMTGMRVRLGVVWAGASLLGGAVVTAAAKLVGAK